MIKVRNTPLSYYVDKLDKCEPFSFVRYGNGEWDAIFETGTITGSHSQKLTVPGLRKSMERSVRLAPRSDNYLLGIQSKRYLSSRGLWKLIEEYVHSCAPDLVWHVGDVFHKASMKGRLFPLVEVLKKRNCYVVGPEYLRKINKYIKVEEFIQVNTRNCYVQLSSVRKKLLSLPRNRVICVSAGPMAKVLIYQLYHQIGDTDTLLDCGSLWDPYAGRRTRRYHKRLNNQKIRANVMGV